jgi:hypothetical protein
MATTTPNYGWAVPTSTDLVKDGATAIETLGDAIDASMNTALGTKKAGMVLLNTTSFSGVASASCPASTFSSTYDNYRIIMDVVPSSNSAANLRMRMKQASDLTDAAYNNAGIGNSTSGSDTTGYTRSGSNQTYWNLSTLPDARRGFYSIDIYAPFLTTSATYFNGQSAINNSAQNVTGGLYSGTTGGIDNSVTAFTIFCAAGNITGTITVFGYNK